MAAVAFISGSSSPALITGSSSPAFISGNSSPALCLNCSIPRFSWKISYSISISASNVKETRSSGEEIEEMKKSMVSSRKQIFVAGSTGRTGKKIVEQLIAKGFGVRAGALDMEKARGSLMQDSNVQIVQTDVTEGPDKLAEAIGNVEAVICATGFRYSLDIFAPWKVDNFGTVNLVEACRKIGVKRFILVSSILVNGAAMGQILNPAYVFLNLFGLTLVAKLQAEQYIRKSGICYTIIRPGGLRDDPPSGNIVMEPEDTLFEGSISREQVAEVAVEALSCPESFYKVVEIVSRPQAPNQPLSDLFSSIKQG